MAAWTLALLGESTAFYLYFAGILSLSLLATLHLAVVGILLLYWGFVWRREGDQLVALLLLSMTLVLGPLGPLGTALCLLLTHRFRKSSQSFQEWYESLFPSVLTEYAKEVLEQVEAAETDSSHASGPVPFIDVMTVGSFRQKQIVLGLIAKHYRPVFAKTLLLALRDESNAIRVQAATTMARIENRFLSRTVKLIKEVEESRNAPASLLRLAQHYDDYAFTGLLDTTRERENRAKALETYKKYLELNPADPAVRNAVARILVRRKAIDEAIEWIRESVEQGYSSPQMLLWWVECEFERGSWNKVRELVGSNGEFFGRQDFPNKLSEALELWNRKSSARSVEEGTITV
jgi:tetratricopeptide (TPR) repeat protein